MDRAIERCIPKPSANRALKRGKHAIFYTWMSGVEVPIDAVEKANSGQAAAAVERCKRLASRGIEVV
eukprot:382110-Amphidinium_carterae.1